MTKCSSKSHYPSKQEVTHSNCGRPLLPVNHKSSSGMLTLLCNSLFTILKTGTQTNAKSRACYKTEETQETRNESTRLDQGLSQEGRIVDIRSKLMLPLASSWKTEEPSRRNRTFMYVWWGPYCLVLSAWHKARHIWEEGTSTKESPPLDCPLGMAMGYFPD